MRNSRSLKQRLDELESRIAITDLVAGYCAGIDRRDLNRFTGLWHDDAEYLIPGRGDFVGTEGMRKSQDMIQGFWRDTHHWTSNHSATFESPHRATGRSDAFAMCVDHDGMVRYVSCTYHDVYERRGTSWKFARRFVDRYFVSAPLDIALLAP